MEIQPKTLLRKKPADKLTEQGLMFNNRTGLILTSLDSTEEFTAFVVYIYQQQWLDIIHIKCGEFPL